jgi:hypothetical protein
MNDIIFWQKQVLVLACGSHMEGIGSNMKQLDRTDPAYLDAIIKKKSQSDSKEVAIRQKIEADMLKEPWSRDAMQQVRDLQKKYLSDAIAHVNDGSYVHETTQRAIEKISGLLRSEIAEGRELLETIPSGSPVLIVTNHFGGYKLAGLRPREDLGVDIPNYDAMYPYPMYFAALHPVAEAIGDGLYYASEDFPLVFGDIHRKAGFVHVPPASIPIEGGRTSYLVDETRNVIRKHPNAAIVNFPEGGTSGKYSGLGPYDLDPFKTGAYVIAQQLGMHILPVAQYFDPRDGFKLKVLKPFVPQAASKEEFENIAEENRSDMLRWFNERQRAVAA